MGTKKVKEKRNVSINCRTTEKIKKIFDEKAKKAGMKHSKMLDKFVTEGEVIILPFGDQIAATLFLTHREINKLHDSSDKQKLHDAISGLIETINQMKDNVQKSCF